MTKTLFIFTLFILFSCLGTAQNPFGTAKAVQTERSIVLSWTVNSDSSVIKYLIQRTTYSLALVTIGTLRPEGKHAYRVLDLFPYEGRAVYRVVAFMKNGDLYQTEHVFIHYRELKDL